MTTDTRPKHHAVRLETAAGVITVGGIAKGAGMIHPDMATLLAVLTTDAVAEPASLQPLLRRVADRSFNADRKSTRLNSSHSQISYAVFCLKKKTQKRTLLYDATC